jgi:hypothetical protein
MELRSSALAPSRFRRPYFDGWDTSKADFEVSCQGCGERISVPFSQILEGAWGWRQIFGPAGAASIESHFKVGTGCKALGGGWPSVSEVDCGKCETTHVFYADFHEYRNSAYRIVAQGFAAYVV